MCPQIISPCTMIVFSFEYKLIARLSSWQLQWYKGLCFGFPIRMFTWFILSKFQKCFADSSPTLNSRASILTAYVVLGILIFLKEKKKVCIDWSQVYLWRQSHLENYISKPAVEDLASEVLSWWFIYNFSFFLWGKLKHCLCPPQH